MMPPKAQSALSAENAIDEIDVDKLYREIESGDGARKIDSEQRSEELLESVINHLLDGDTFEFDESIVKASLDDILLVLVALRDADTHGKETMEDLEMVFDADLSPGTVYPRLHELEDENLLRVHELVRTKEYSVDDERAVRDHIEKTMQQHLVLGTLLHAALDEL